MWTILFWIATRTLYLGYCGLAGWTFLEVRKLLNPQYVWNGKDTFRIPLVVCEPTFLATQGANNLTSFWDTTNNNMNTVIANANLEFDQGCRTLNWWVHATSFILATSAGAVLLYVFVHLAIQTGASCCVSKQERNNGEDIMLARRRQSQRLSSMGAFFLAFVLVQAAFTVASVAAECQFWSNHVARLWQAQQSWNGRVTTHANPVYLWATGGTACVVALVLLMELFVSMCCSNNKKQEEEDLDLYTIEDTVEGRKVNNATTSSLSEQSDSMTLGTQTNGSSGFSERPPWSSKV